LPETLRGTIDAAVLESCLHHFFDPIAALTHIAEGLGPNGLVLILEGENRAGPIKPEHLKVMMETSTLERPYPRHLLLETLEAAGLPYFVFLSNCSGFMPSPAIGGFDMNQHLQEVANGRNLCLCARDAAALRRIFPDYAPASPAPPAPAPAALSAAPLSTAAPRLRDTLPLRLRLLLWPVWRALTGRRG